MIVMAEGLLEFEIFYGLLQSGAVAGQTAVGARERDHRGHVGISQGFGEHLGGYSFDPQQVAFA